MDAETTATSQHAPAASFDLAGLFTMLAGIKDDIAAIKAEASNTKDDLTQKIVTIGGDVQHILSKGAEIEKAAGVSETIDKIVAALEKHMGVVV